MGYFVDGDYVESDFYSLEEEQEYAAAKKAYDKSAEEDDPSYAESLRRQEARGQEMFDPETGESLGMSGENAKANAEAWRLDEIRKLEAMEKEKLSEAKFKTTEGQGMRRQANLTFGNQDEDRQRTGEQRSLAATGRFDTNKLVL